MLADDLRTTLLEPRPFADFVQTDSIRNISDRALAYLAAGFPVHFRGGAGTGKTTLAMHIAAMIGRPVIMLHGDEEMAGSDLIGNEHGYYARRVLDNYIHSVRKTEEEYAPRWVDNRLTVAAKHGFTLVYDEFTRSRPEANNVLLAVLQERLLDLHGTGTDGTYVRVHPAFSAIFTSNPGDYAGVFKSQDALFDRMVTIDLDYFDEETERAITQARAQVGPGDARRIVGLTRSLRAANVCDVAPTVRSCIKLARTARLSGARVSANDPRFRQACMDILVSGCTRDATRPRASLRDTVDQLISEYCGDERRNATAQPAPAGARRRTAPPALVAVVGGAP